LRADEKYSIENLIDISPAVFGLRNDSTKIISTRNRRLAEKYIFGITCYSSVSTIFDGNVFCVDKYLASSNQDDCRNTGRSFGEVYAISATLNTHWHVWTTFSETNFYQFL
jgi:hypothetical protein